MTTTTTILIINSDNKNNKNALFGVTKYGRAFNTKDTLAGFNILEPTE